MMLGRVAGPHTVVTPTDCDAVSLSLSLSLSLLHRTGLGIRRCQAVWAVRCMRHSRRFLFFFVGVFVCVCACVCVCVCVCVPLSVPVCVAFPLLFLVLCNVFFVSVVVLFSSIPQFVGTQFFLGSCLFAPFRGKLQETPARAPPPSPLSTVDSVQQNLLVFFSIFLMATCSSAGNHLRHVRNGNECIPTLPIGFQQESGYSLTIFLAASQELQRRNYWTDSCCFDSEPATATTRGQ